jgi:hypothetical protein
MRAWLKNQDFPVPQSGVDPIFAFENAVLAGGCYVVAPIGDPSQPWNFVIPEPNCRPIPTTRTAAIWTARERCRTRPRPTPRAGRQAGHQPAATALPAVDIRERRGGRYLVLPVCRHMTDARVRQQARAVTRGSACRSAW